MVTSPATGTARGLASSDTTGSPPVTRDQHRRHADLGGKRDPERSATGRGPGRAAASGRASTAMASDAPTDSWNPTERTSSGSISTSAATASASVRTDR